MDVEVRKSLIEGRGAFAMRDFEEGEPVLTWTAQEIDREDFNNLSSEERNHTEIQDGKILLLGEPACYVNHACEPNMISRGKTDIAARYIKAGEELTVDYANCTVPDGSFRCSCGGPNCRGLITGKKSADMAPI